MPFESALRQAQGPSSVFAMNVAAKTLRSLRRRGEKKTKTLCDFSADFAISAVNHL